MNMLKGMGPRERLGLLMIAAARAGAPGGAVEVNRLGRAGHFEPRAGGPRRGAQRLSMSTGSTASASVKPISWAAVDPASRM